LRDGLNKLERLESRIARLKISDFGALSQALETRNMALTGRAVIQASLTREESRSEHFREDFPARDDKRWLRNVVVSLDRTKALSFQSLPASNA
jgi:succinate dehydrogenase/fumarate reductase flavoprotein subunit